MNTKRLSCRTGVFETNSSAMHSVAIKNPQFFISKKERKAIVEPYLMSNGKIDLADYMPESFEGYRVLDTFIEKLCYTIASLYGASDRYEWPEIRKSILKAIKVPGVTGFHVRKHNGEYKIATVNEDNTRALFKALPCVWSYEDEEWVRALRTLLFSPDYFILMEFDGVLSPEYLRLLKI